MAPRDVRLTLRIAATQVVARKRNLHGRLHRATNMVATVLRRAEEQRVVKLALSELDPLELVYRSYTVEVNENFHDERAIKEMADLCEAALRLDRNFVPAMLCKADWLMTPLDKIGASWDRELLDIADNLTVRAVSLAPTLGAAWDMRANALRFQKKWDAALEANSRAIQIDKGRPGSLWWRGQLMLWGGRPEEVFPLMDRLLEIDPTGQASAELERCEAHVSLGQFDKAAAVCERAASEDPHWMVHIALAVTYAHLGDMAKATAAKDKAVSRQRKLTLATYRASREIKADTPKQWEQHYKYWEPGLRMAGLREN
jgi:tetratricopeptide (TPR) repeat protein